MFGLTTVHDTLLCLNRAERRLVHRHPAAVDPADLLLCPSMERPELGLLGPDGIWRPLDVGTVGAPRATAPPSLDLFTGNGLLAIRGPSGFLAAPPDGTTTMNSPEPHGWEFFGTVGRPGLVDLIALCRASWLRVGTRTLVEPHDIGLTSHVGFRFGGHSYPIAGNLPLSGSSGRPRNLLFRDGWIVEEIRRFEPLVYFVLMGAGAYAEQLRLATRSLVEFGRYRGRVLVITDQPHHAVEALLPEALHPGLATMDVASSGKIDAVLARLMLAEYPGAERFTPILYSDTDVIFDQPLIPFLQEALLGGRMSAQSEPWNRLPDSDAAGGDLFRADPIPFRDEIGFNAGVWAMPGGLDSLQILDAVRHSVSRYLEINGRDSLPWLDQAMGNYVLRKLDAFDARLITAATRLYQSYEPLEVTNPAGFVHFWPVAASAHERVVAMADYVERLHLERFIRAKAAKTAAAS